MKRLVLIGIFALAGAFSIRGSEVERATQALTERFKQRNDELMRERLWIENQFRHTVKQAQLLEACAAGRAVKVEVLLDTPFIDVNWTDSDGISALHWAAWKGSSEAVNHLTKRNNLNLTLPTPSGKTAQQIADERGHQEVVQLLTDAVEKKTIENTEHTSEI